MIVLVCGGSDYDDAKNIWDHLDELKPDCVLQGGASGADYFAKTWAHKRGIPSFQCVAQWNSFGKAAGPIRNGWMIKFMKPDLVLAFPTPKSRGTYDMIRQAENAEILVKVIQV